ncbi:FAD-dependent oxidoreductase [Nakamurella sp.]|uniref:FAD-dependent oxidoreductase n=1 Tax=Nakamurella sp. TaxID=1869182 RepID=UPI003783EFAA
MKVAIIGAGPTGLLLGIGLARRGHQVVAVDRDAGPAADGTWARRGVMQFHHAHGFRPQIARVLQREAPAAWASWLVHGGEPIEMTLPDGTLSPAGVRSRRSTFEIALRAAALQQPGLRIRQGHVEQVDIDRGRASGIRVDGAELQADLVLDASGRASRATRNLRTGAHIGGPCGIAYVDRQYRLRDGVPTPPMDNPLAWQGEYDGYQVIVFLHERGTFSTLIVRNTSDRSLVPLRHNAAFDAAARAIPGLAAWTDPAVSRPLTEVLPGGPLLNLYRGQRSSDGDLALPGLIFVGDAVCTTTPNFGRGITTCYLQVGRLLELIDGHARAGDIVDRELVAIEFDAWCEHNMRPWVEDHRRMDDALTRRWDGQDIDLTDRLPSDLIMSAASQDASIRPAIVPYVTMQGLPSCLDEVEPRAKAVFRTGWRPPLSEGPGRAELADIVTRAAAA